MAVSIPESHSVHSEFSTPSCDTYSASPASKKSLLNSATPVVAVPKPQESFFGLLFEIPVINSTVSTIKRVIPDSKFTSMVSSVATKISTIADSNIPTDSSFRKSLNAIDNQACLSLKNMETKYPIITKPTDKLVQDVKNSIADIEKKYKPLHFIVEKAQNLPHPTLNNSNQPKNSTSENDDSNTSNSRFSSIVNLPSSIYNFGKSNVSKLYQSSKTYDYTSYTMNKIDSIKNYADVNFTAAKTSAISAAQSFNSTQVISNFSDKINLPISLWFASIKDKSIGIKQSMYMPSFMSSFIDSKLDTISTIISKKD
ncbi:hypothetical protein BB561_005393 [Smittium simulii]|uniref:Uncharacterized protein n=1 Tax=Smittium simulii TaxID=133385 RepID=A0A2T9YAP2_9FUNG|nr:hypothetical protein BB561_005393 [Smittium simulii]